MEKDKEMLQWNAVVRWLPIICLCVIATGCGSGFNRPKMAKVIGRVTFKGLPLNHGEITFLSADNRPAHGKIIAGQIIEVMTFEPDDGAPIGPCKVAISALENPNADMYTPSKSLLPAKYGNPETSGLTADLKPGENDVNFELTEE